jgi:hypothetical protein
MAAYLLAIIIQYWRSHAYIIFASLINEHVSCVKVSLDDLMLRRHVSLYTSLVSQCCYSFDCLLQAKPFSVQH